MELGIGDNDNIASFGFGKVDPLASSIYLADGYYSKRIENERKGKKSGKSVSSLHSFDTITSNYAKLLERTYDSKTGTTILGEIIPQARHNSNKFADSILSRMRVSHDFSMEEIMKASKFPSDLTSLQDDPEIQEIIGKTEIYKGAIEDSWNTYQKPIMEHITKVLGANVTPERRVRINVMPPKVRNINRSVNDDKTNIVDVYYSKKARTDTKSVLGELVHAYVHNSLLRNGIGWTNDQKEHYHAFIKYLTNKEVYLELSKAKPFDKDDITTASYFDLVTTNENPKAMADVYPVFLAYRYRNAASEGLNPANEIKAAIERDKKAYRLLQSKARTSKANLPKLKQAFESAKRRKDVTAAAKARSEYKKAKATIVKFGYFQGYDLDSLDAQKIAAYGVGHKGMTPKQFATIDYKTIRSRFTHEQDLAI